VSQSKEHIRVLYSFPHKLGAARICYTAWHQVNGLAAAGADVIACPGAVARAVAPNVTVRPTLARGRFRIPYRLIGSMRAFALHDAIVARRVEQLAGQIDIVHTWPLGSLRTLKTAAKLGIPTVLERPNANTHFAIEVVQKECRRLGIALPADHEYAYNAEKLAIEEEEYELATKLLCPSDFVARTFLERGFPQEKLARHAYGYDEKRFRPSLTPRDPNQPFTMLFAGVCAVRKGVHYALEAWYKSEAHKDGIFQIAGEFLPSYREKLASMLSRPGVRVLGHRNDLPELMQNSDVLVLPTLEEGSALVTSEARGSGCVLLVSKSSGAVCQHLENALVHEPGDVATLAAQITMLYRDRQLLNRLRDSSLRTANEITWTAAGKTLLQVYRETIESHSRRYPFSLANQPTSEDRSLALT
jgi:glycosyltransferase involved in cell wall biosynthesis